jgi:mRNA interferase HigB
LELLGKYRLLKLKKKNKGNIKLIKAIDELINDITESNWSSKIELQKEREDADLVHNDGFFFFDINIHRTMILIIFDNNEANIIWTGTHDEYERIFKNNKTVIETWLRNKGLIK